MPAIGEQQATDLALSCPLPASRALLLLQAVLACVISTFSLTDCRQLAFPTSEVTLAFVHA